MLSPAQKRAQNRQPQRGQQRGVDLRHSFGSSLKFNFISIGLRQNPPLDFLPRLRGAFDDKTAHDQIIHFRVHETTICVIRRADNRFAAHIERRVHQHAAAGRLLEPRSSKS